MRKEAAILIIAIAVTFLYISVLINAMPQSMINKSAMAQSVVKKFAYEAIIPTGSYDYLKAVKGTVYPYQGSNAGHVDRMVYIYSITSPTLSVGAGHYEFPTGAINFMMYVDEGINDNFHYVVSSPTPSNSYTAEVVRSGNTFYAKINGSTIRTYTCSSDACRYAKIFGAVSWGTKSSSDFNVYGNIWNLQFMRPNDTQYQNYVSGVGTLIKCYEQPSDLGFKSPRTQPYNQIIVDATNNHDCVGYNSTAWLYNNGAGG